MFAIKRQYNRQELLDVLWPGEPHAWTDAEKAEKERMADNLAQVLTAARHALALDASRGALKMVRGVVHRVKGQQIAIASDLETFREHARSDDPEALRLALTLVRGRVAEHLPQVEVGSDWLDVAREAQQREITEVLKRLDPNVTSEELRHHLREVLEGRYDRPTHQPSIGLPESHEPITDEQHANPPPPVAVVPRKWRRRVALAALLACVGTGLVVWMLSPSSKHSPIPPPGSIVNAQTGQIAYHAQIVPGHLPAQIGGGSNFKACDLSRERSCGYGKTTLQARVGDTILFRVMLNNGSGLALPYLKLRASWQPETGSQERTKSLEVNMSLRWPEGSTGEHVYELTTNSPPVDPIHVQLQTAGHYGLTYIPGSTTLKGREGHFFHYLPDGIMDTGGIALQDVGQPASCFWCALEYIREVYFHAKIT
jgi:hypothetical protein